MTKKYIGIAMSGGVDSTATAILQKAKGPVKGFFMKLNQPDFAEQRKRVENIANTLGIELEIIDLQEAFQKKVLDYFSASYFHGTTPNPCVVCNKEIKFGLFHEAMLAQGVEQIATGHYAQIIKNGDQFELHKGVDPKKDQSYFLSRLTQEQLSRSLFPLGAMHKSAIYDLVEEHGFHDFRGTESQDVCFLEHESVATFLENADNYNSSSGKIITEKGEVLGKHTGLHRYTVGQRRGLGIAYHAPLYVIALDTNRNAVIVGENDALFKDTIEVKELQWLSSPNDLEEIEVRIRSTHQGAKATLSCHGEQRATITFSQAQRAITPGQFATIYHGSRVLGSGIIL